jgi:hypothetical protein
VPVAIPVCVAEVAYWNQIADDDEMSLRESELGSPSPLGESDDESFETTNYESVVSEVVSVLFAVALLCFQPADCLD